MAASSSQTRPQRQDRNRGTAPRQSGISEERLYELKYNDAELEGEKRRFTPEQNTKINQLLVGF